MSSVEQSPVQHTLVREIDYGTPPAKTEKSVTLSIDGRQVSVPEGTSIMRAAMETGIEIRVPPFIKAGERVKVSTETREFAGRA